MSDTPASLKKLKVNELRDKCKEFGIDNKGTKSILIHRILSHLGIIHEEIDENSAMEDSANLSSQQQSLINSSVLERSTSEIKQPPIASYNKAESSASPQPPTTKSVLPSKESTVDTAARAPLSSSKAKREDIHFKAEAAKTKVGESCDKKDSIELRIESSEPKNEHVELDFVQDDQVIFETSDAINQKVPTISITPADPAVSAEPKKKSAIPPIKVQSKRVCETEDGEKYPVKYIKDIVHIDPYINDLHFVMCDETLLTGCNLIKNDLCQFWCGVKASHGLANGKAYFACKYNSKSGDGLSANKLKDLSHGLRVGFSSLNESLHLGDVGYSCGFDDTGRVYANGKIVGTGKKFSVNDRITAIIEYQNPSAVFKFLVNDEDCGVVATLEAKDATFFPHIYFKNIKFTLDFKTKNETLLEHTPFQSLMPSLVSNYRPCPSFKDCELLIMVGIVASGKSHWVQTFAKSNPAKSYNVIGRSFLYDRWRHVSQTKRHHLSERIVSQAVSKLIALAQARPRNYILDQTNCFSSTRKRRLESFKEFGKKSAVLVMPRLSELASRIESYKKSSQNISSDDRTLHLDDVAELKENLVLPTLEEGFTDIVYVDCDETTAPQSLADYKYDAARYKELKAKELKVKESSIIRPLPKKRTRRPSPPSFQRRRPISSSSNRRFPERKIAMLSPPSRRRTERSPSPRRNPISLSRNPQFEPNRRFSPQASRPLSKYKSAGKTESKRRDYSPSFNKTLKEGYSGYSRIKASKPDISFNSSNMPINYRVAMPTSRNYSSRETATEQSTYRDTGYSNYEREVAPIPRVSAGRSDQAQSYSASRRVSNVYGMGRSEATPYGGIPSNQASHWSSQHEDRRTNQPMTQHSSSYQSSPPTRSYNGANRQNYASTSTQRGGYGGYSTSGYNSHF